MLMSVQTKEDGSAADYPPLRKNLHVFQSANPIYNATCPVTLRTFI